MKKTCRIIITKSRDVQIVRLQGKADSFTRRIARAIHAELIKAR